MRGAFGQRFQRQTDRVCDRFVTNLARRAGTGFIIQTIKPGTVRNFVCGRA
jgi:hypothetical protein